MKNTLLATLATVLALHAAEPVTPATSASPATPTPPPVTKPVVDVVFVLDSTGSMSGLIEGAKEKIWSIANSIVGQKPSPAVRLGLFSYRDRKDDYVTRKFDLTDDIDTVFKNLQTFKAGGGGDTPESVNQALHEAVTQMTWSTAKDATKIIFLVGDCPPHMDYQDDIKYPVTCQKAAASAIIINTVQCGNHADTTPIWQEIARLAEGSYIALAQTGGMVAMTTPHDAEIAKLSAAIGETSVAYGSAVQQQAVREKNTVAKAAPAAVAASRADYNTKTGGKAIQGRGDLVADLADGTVALKSVKEADLPPEMKKMSEAERATFLETQRTKRAALNQQLEAIVRKRSDFIEQEKARLAKDGKGDSFDVKVEETVKEQFKRNQK